MITFIGEETEMTNCYKVPSESEKAFATAYANNDWKQIWLSVYEACKANAKKLLKVSLDDDVFHDRLMTAVETCIRYLQEGKAPKGKLITYCYFPTLAAFCGPKAIKEDKRISYETMVENGYDVSVDILGQLIE